MDSFSLEILKLYNSRQRLSLIQLGAVMNRSPIDLGQYVIRLKEKSYLCIAPDYAAFQTPDQEGLISPDTPIQITIDGKEFLEDQKRINKQQRTDSIRYAITTGIALLALIISVIALIAQLGLIRLPQL